MPIQSEWITLRVDYPSPLSLEKFGRIQGNLWTAVFPALILELKRGLAHGRRGLAEQFGPRAI